MASAETTTPLASESGNALRYSNAMSGLGTQLTLTLDTTGRRRRHQGSVSGKSFERDGGCVAYVDYERCPIQMLPCSPGNHSPRVDAPLSFPAVAPKWRGSAARVRHRCLPRSRPVLVAAVLSGQTSLIDFYWLGCGSWWRSENTFSIKTKLLRLPFT